MNLDTALASVSEFLKELRFGDDADLEGGGTLTFANQTGGMELTGNDRANYQKCLRNLLDGISKTNTFSRRGVETLFQQMLIEAKTQDEQDHLSLQSIKASVAWLRKALSAKTEPYLVYMQVVGIDPSNLPLTVGTVTFLHGDVQTIEGLKTATAGHIRSLQNDARSKRVLKSHHWRSIKDNFAGKVISEVEIQAGDDNHAVEQAMITCRRSIDAINCFGALLAGSITPGVALVGEGNDAVTVMKPQDKGKYALFMQATQAPGESGQPYKDRIIERLGHVTMPRGPLRPLTLPHPESPRPVEQAFARVSKLLAKTSPSKLEERILAAVQWAGRATVNHRTEEAFLLYMIALESLVLVSNTTSDLTFQLRLKTAHLIGRNREAREWVYQKIKELYHIRSCIVHSGEFEVTDAELAEVRVITQMALLVVIGEKPFRDMTDTKAFDDWLTEQSLANADNIEAPGNH